MEGEGERNGGQNTMREGFINLHQRMTTSYGTGRGGGVTSMKLGPFWEGEI